MTNEIIAITYVHSHDCARKGEQVIDRPICRGGVAFAGNPICIELMVQLELVSVLKA